MRDLREDAHSVTGLSLSIPARPVLKVLYDGEGIIYKCMALSSLYVNDRAYAAVVSCSKDGS